MEKIVENHEDYAYYTSFVNKASITTKNSPVKTSTVSASQTKIGFIKSQSINPKQKCTYSTTQINTSNNEGNSAQKAYLTQICLNSTRRGKDLSFKERESSRQRYESASKQGTTRIDESKKANLALASQNFIKKISALEGKIRQLLKEKQQITHNFTSKIQILQQENKRLAALVRNSCKQAVPQLKFNKGSEFNLEEMMSIQIEINLQLREENERIRSQLAAQSNKCIELQNLNKNLQDKQQEKDRIQEIQALKLSFSQQRQKLARDNKKLQKEMKLINGEHSKIMSQADALKRKIAELERQECKKCKQLLHTVFRLNSQLNKK